MSRRIHFRTVSPEFRETIQREMPGIDKNPRYWYLFEWLAFVTHDTDKVTGYPILTSKEIAYLEDRERRVKSHRYRTADFIEGFAADVNHIELTGWDGIHGSARCVEPFEWPQAVKEAIEVELCHPSRARERVILTTGVKLHTRVVRDYRLDLRDEGMASLRDNGCDEAWDLLKYLNTQESSNSSFR